MRAHTDAFVGVDPSSGRWKTFPVWQQTLSGNRFKLDYRHVYTAIGDGQLTFEVMFASHF